MIYSNLYESILLAPFRNTNANKLFIVSGYASATFTRRHISDLLNIKDNIQINLIVGMPGKKSDHLAFIDLHKEFQNKFLGYYFTTNPPVHSKVYSWFDNENPIQGYAGSANYSQYGFFENQQQNQISKENPQLIKDYYSSLINQSVYMPDLDVILPVSHNEYQINGSIPAGNILWEIPNKRVTISFLDVHGKLPAVSGLNWGQRKEKRINKSTGKVSYVTREPNQAYLSLKLDSRKDGFLPEKAFNFSLITDDGQSFDCVVAQDSRKAILTTKDNSLLGKYFRIRLGVSLGEFVTKEHLEKYGRTDYTIEKINPETFLLDFSKP